MADYADREVLDPLRDHSKTGGLLLTAMGGDFRKPSEEQAGFLSRYNRLPRRYSLAFAPPERYFREVRRRAGRTLPALASDFNPLMQGTYSSRIRLKQANRRLENLAFALGLLEGGRPEPRDSDRLWETIAWNAFHDIICGTLTTEAFREALRDYARAEVEAGAALAQAIVGRAGRAGRPFRTPADHAVALFNPLPYARNELVEIPLVRPGLPACRVAATTPEGRPLESQTVACGSAVSVLVNLPLDPASIRSIGLRPGGPRAPRSPAGPLRAGARRLENDRLRAVFGANGTIVSLVDKDHGTELVPSGGGAGMNNFVRQYDHGDLWSLYRKPVNGSLLYTAEQRDPLPDCTPGLRRHGGVSAGGCDTRAWPARIRLAERGPLRAALEIEYPDAGLTTRVSLARDEKLLRFRTRLIPAGKRWRLRAVFPTTIRAGTIRRSIPCGFVRQPEGEFPAQDWIDYSDGEKGVCLINAGLPGNNVTDGILCLSLFRAVAMEDRDPLPWYEEGMEHVFDYALRPFGAGDKDYRPAREGARFNQPIRAAFCGDGAARILGPICAMKGEGVEWMGFRRGDDGSAEIRLYESEGRKTEIELVFPHRLRHGVKTDFTGTALKSERVAIRGATATVRLRPFEIAALRIR